MTRENNKWMDILPEDMKDDVMMDDMVKMVAEWSFDGESGG